MTRAWVLLAKHTEAHYVGKNVKLGDKVMMTFPAFPGEVFESMAAWRPLLNQMDDYIVDVEAVYKIKLTDATPWYLKIGGDWEFESEPGDAKASDLDYFMSIGRTF